MANVGGPNNNQPQPGLQAFQNTADGARDNTQIKVDRNTGNVGTRSLFGRAWRAVTPQNIDRREGNRSDIEKFRVALLNEGNKKSNVRIALDTFLPGHQNGNVPLTAGAVRRSIEYVNIQKMTVASAIDQPQFRNIFDKQEAAENLNFYLEARGMLGDGGDRIDVGQFKSLVARYVAVGSEKEINIPPGIRRRMTLFAEHTNVPSYSAAQSEAARHLLREGQRAVRKLMEVAPLNKFRAILTKQLEQR